MALDSFFLNRGGKKSGAFLFMNYIGSLERDREKQLLKELKEIEGGNYGLAFSDYISPLAFIDIRKREIWKEIFQIRNSDSYKKFRYHQL